MNSDRLILTNIEKAFGSKKILSNISFSIGVNEIVGLLGPNGAGKTTAFYIAAGLIFPNEGKVFINNQDVTNAPMHARANLGLGYLPQEASIFPDLSVESNLLGIAELTDGNEEEQISKVKKVVDSLTAAPKFLSSHKPVDVKVYAVQTEFDKKKWEEFIVNQGIGEWTNVGDILKDPDGNPAASSNWRDQYDIYSTPVIYLLDKDKKILAKRISYKQISEIIKRLEK